MAGHSQYKNIMHRKGAQDAKRAKIFTKLIRDLTVAVQQGGGSDPESNSALRLAIDAAKAANMPKDTQERAIKRGLGNAQDAHYESLQYEGYGPSGCALIVECLTDNRNRTAAEVRSAFNKYGGTLGKSNSVQFLFDHVAVIFYEKKPGLTEEALFDVATENGALDVQTLEEGFEIVAAPKDFAAVRMACIHRFGTPAYAEIIWRAKESQNAPAEYVDTLRKLTAALDQCDDVQDVWCTWEIPEGE